MPHTASISRSQFEQWATAALRTSKVPSVRALAKVSGISKSTLSYQLNADAIPASSVIQVSRGIGGSPLADLGSFPGFEQLLEPVQAPSTAELLALVSPRDLLLEAARRLGTEFAHWQMDEFTPGKTYWSPWFKTAAPRATYSAVRELIGISETQIAKNHKEGNWSVEHLALMSQAFDFNALMALVVSGNLTFQEVDLSPTIRQQALADASDEDLQFRIEKLVPSLAEKMNTSSIDCEPKHVILDVLG
ncbi:hypothetical protein [Rothia nasimurium]|uniref:hypothetical protein n=1 Tax=Rothia nasimurium TaxID=85336 RepID=UPI001F1DDBDE|nr:hypothetical protein [Rothia nasimurium]